MKPHSRRLRSTTLSSGGLLLALLASSTPCAASQEGRPGFVWDAERAEHLWNRAGFGAAPEEIERAVELGLEPFVAELLAGEDWLDEPFYTRIRGASRMGRGRMMGDGDPGDTDDERMREERREQKNEERREDGLQLRDYMAWWVDRMVRGDDPLRERMTLFWHGHFTSSMQDVRNSHEMILQNQLLRKHALGSFRVLLHAIARDPAMLEYLDNDSNRRGSPNENFARELLELFTLGEGNYSEQDIKEAARAFTGWTDRRGTFVFERRRHDFGEKTVLGVTGRLDGDDVLEILLEQEACARYLAGKLITYLEGTAPEPERLERYADLLRGLDYDIGGFLRELFTDRDFYRPEVVGNRISGPIDYVVGSARRIGVEPPSELVLAGATLLGQRLFFPPNVKGWEGGAAWITTSSLMHRGNLSGVMLGQVAPDDFLSDGQAMMEEMLLEEGDHGGDPDGMSEMSGMGELPPWMGRARPGGPP